MAEQAFHSHTNNKITVSGTIDLADTKSTLRMLTAKEEDSTMFSTLEETTSDSSLDKDTCDNDNVHYNHHSSHGSPDEQVEDHGEPKSRAGEFTHRAD